MTTNRSLRYTILLKCNLSLSVHNKYSYATVSHLQNYAFIDIITKAVVEHANSSSIPINGPKKSSTSSGSGHFSRPYSIYNVQLEVPEW